MRDYPRLVFDRKRALGEIVLEYGSTNPIEGSNVQPVAWCLDVWSLGADGVIPGKLWVTPIRGTGPTNFRSFIPGPRRSAPAGKPG